MRKKIIIIAGWLAAWQLFSLIIHNPILMAGPLETLRALAELLGTAEFAESLAFSFLRIVGGFLTGSAAGILLAYLADQKSILREILSPLVTVLKSVPVASFIILALIWFGSGALSFVISFLVVFPILYLNTLQGLQNLDGKLLEMAEVFHIPASSRLKYIVLPGIYPFLQSGFELALGMSWKSGVAAELIGQYKLSIGNQLYMDKITLDTAGVLAWTVVILAVSWLFEKFFLLLVRTAGGKTLGATGKSSESAGSEEGNGRKNGNARMEEGNGRKNRNIGTKESRQQGSTGKGEKE